MSSLKDQLDEAERHISTHPAYVEWLAINAFSRTLHDVFLDNRSDLLALLEQASNDVMLAVELVQNVRKPVIRERFQAAVNKRLHNYVAGASTVIDHSRRLTQDRTGPLAEEFNERKAALTSIGEVAFLKDLRNYTVHRELPELCHRMGMTKASGPDWKMSSEVELASAILLEWGGWSATSKSFIKSCGAAVELRPTIQQHGDLMYDLNAWLLSGLAEANAPALAEVNRLVVERNAILTGGNVEAACAMSNPPWLRDSEHGTD